MMKALQFLSDNAAAITLAMGIFFSVFNWAAKPRTKEELEAMPARAAAFFRFMAATFPDPHKATEAAWQFWKNTHDRLPPKSNTKGGGAS